MINSRKINTNLFLLLFGRLVSDVGSSVQMLIMPLYIIDIGGSASTIGLFSFFSLVPILLMYPFGGVIGDRLNRKRIMVGADFFSAILISLLAYISYIGKINLTSLLLIQVLVSFMYGFFDPATKGMIPQIVKKEDLGKTNSKVATLRILSGIVAPLLAVSLYIKYGITLLFLLNAVSFFISALSEMLIKYKHVKKDNSKGFRGIIDDMHEGGKFIKNSKVIGMLSVYFLLVFTFIQPMFAIVLPLFFRTKLSYSDTQYGYLQIALFLGALFGSVLVSKFAKDEKLKKTLILGISSLVVMVMGYAILLTPKVLSYMGSSSISYIISFAAILFMLYASIMFINIPLQTIIQTKTPNEYMSRVFSIVGVISKGGMPLGALLYGFILNKMEIHIAVILAAIIVMIVSIRFLSIFRNIEEI